MPRSNDPNVEYEQEGRLACRFMELDFSGPVVRDVPVGYYFIASPHYADELMGQATKIAHLLQKTGLSTARNLATGTDVQLPPYMQVVIIQHGR